MKKFKLIMLFSFLSVIILFVACSKDDGPNNNNQNEVNSCIGCHTNYTHLKEVHTPDTDLPSGGCGGETPHIEPYDRVYLSGAGWTAFQKTVHGKMECTECHNGVGNTADKALAHSGDFLKHPSKSADEKCASCHSSIVVNAKNNIHNGWGQKRKVTLRMGLSGANDFAMLPASMQEGYNKNCATCHASCGECHVLRPKATGGGLLKGHNFSKNPDMLDVCIACHSSRGGHAFLGIASGTLPDVHLTKAQFQCTSCHTKNELHGNGQKFEHRYQVSMLPKCTDCHQSISKSNNYHSMHFNDFSCNVCHSQSYNNCQSCHIGGDGARFPSHLNFKIGMNPIRDTRDYKLALLRPAPSGPDSWEKYGVAQYTNFEAMPTWNYTTPHNILKWTTQTQVASGKACYDACHIVKDNDGTIRNKNLYLFESDLKPWEVNASKGITVDGKLPSSWKVE